MKRSTLLVAVLVVVALGLGGLFVLANRSNDEPTSSATSESTSSNTQGHAGQDTTAAPETPDTNQTADDEVEIEDFAFTPTSITVKKGTTVTWTNKDSDQHNVVPDDGDSEVFKGSDLLSKDASYSFTFNTPGTYSYHCGPHPYMTGTVTVTE